MKPTTQSDAMKRYGALVPIIARMAEQERAAERAIEEGDDAELDRVRRDLNKCHAEIGEALDAIVP